jgi:hypothetical protein
LHGPIPCGSPADDAALAFITEPLGLCFVVMISQLLDAVQCGVASAARQGRLRPVSNDGRDRDVATQ